MKRLRPALSCLVLLLAFVCSIPVSGHEGEVHGDQGAPQSAGFAPRIAAETEEFSLVALADGDELTVYLDDSATNAPVENAGVDVLVASANAVAKETEPGIYKAHIPALLEPKVHDLIFTVVTASGSDLVSGQLDLKDPKGGRSADAGQSIRAPIRNHPYWFIGGATALFLVAMVFLAAGLPVASAFAATVSVAALVGVSTSLLLPNTNPAPAGHGNPHSGRAERPMRLPDGSVLMPKATQRLLGLRTLEATNADASMSTSLVGELIPDPNSHGMVQPSVNGIIRAPEAGWPYIGKSVRREEILARIAPTLELVDHVEIQEQIGELEQSIALVRQKLNRAAKLKGTVAQKEIDDLRLELKELKERRQAIRPILSQHEVLKSPVDGVIAAVNGVPGQVVDAKELIFEIVDPQRLWVRAVAYDSAVVQEMVQAIAIDRRGRTLHLEFVGRGPALLQQAVSLLFRVKSPDGSNMVGEPVEVVLRTRRRVEGVVVPDRAVVPGDNNAPQVWEHRAPEVFVAHDVRTAPLDGDTVLILSGLKAGTKIVHQGAALVSQIR